MEDKRPKMLTVREVARTGILYRKGVWRMKMLIECSRCGMTIEADVDGIIRTMLDCAENESIYSGFLCEECAEGMDEEF